MAAAVVIAMLLTMSSSYDVMLWQPSMRLGASWITVKVHLTQGKATAFFLWHTFRALWKNVCGGSHECHHLAARSVAVTLSRQTAARIWIMVSWVLVTILLLVTIS